MTTQACARHGNDCSKLEQGHPSPPPALITGHARPTHGLSTGDTVNVQRGHSWHKARVIDVHMGPAALQEDLVRVRGSLINEGLQGVDNEVVPRHAVIAKPGPGGGHFLNRHGTTCDVSILSWTLPLLRSGFKVRWGAEATDGAREDTWVVHDQWMKVGADPLAGVRQPVKSSEAECGVAKTDIDQHEPTTTVPTGRLPSDQNKVKKLDAGRQRRPVEDATQANPLPQTAAPSQQTPLHLIGGTGQPKPAKAASVHRTILKMLIDAGDGGLSQKELQAADGVGQKHVFAFKRVATTLGMMFTPKMVRNGRITDVMILTHEAMGFYQSLRCSKGQGTNVNTESSTGRTLDRVGTSTQRKSSPTAGRTMPGSRQPPLPDGQGLKQPQQPQGAGCELEHEDILVGVALLRRETPFTREHMSEVISAIKGKHAHSKDTTKRRVNETLAVLAGLGLIDQISANEGTFRGTFRCIPPKEVCLLETAGGDTATRKIRALLLDAEGNRIPVLCRTM